MSLPLYKLQEALYARLSGDGVLMGLVQAVHDTVPQHSAFPYVVIGDGRQHDVPAGGVTTVRCALEIEVFSRSKGRKEALLILDRIYALLHRNVVTVDGFECIVIRCDTVQTEVLLDALTLRGSMQVAVMLGQEAV
jgi:hypothetical protein